MQPLRPEELWPEVVQPIPWIIEAAPDTEGRERRGLLASGQIVMLGARHGVGKTWTMLELLAALTTGSTFLGRFPVTRPCRVMLVDEEASLWLLQDRWSRVLRGRRIGREHYLDKLAAQMLVYQGRGFSFDDEASYAALEAHALMFRPDVSVFDTFVRVHDRAENDNSAVAALFRDRIKPFMRVVGGSVIFPHHAGKPSRDGADDAASMLRGASDLAAEADHVWLLYGTGDGRWIFEHNKSRAGVPHPSFSTALRDTEDGAVVVEAEGGLAVLPNLSQMARAQEAMLRYLMDHGPSPRPLVLGAAALVGVSKRTAEEALGALVVAQRVAKTKAGRTTRYARVEGLE